MERENVTSRIDKRDPITNAPLPPDNIIACDKQKKQKARKVLDRKAPPTSDCGSTASCFAAHLYRPQNHSNTAWNPDVNYSAGRGSV